MPKTAKRQQHPQWEYCLIQLPPQTPDPAALAEEMNALGADGWELCAAEGQFLVFIRAA